MTPRRTDPVRITVLRHPDPAAALRQADDATSRIPALRLQRPIDLPTLIRQWCGVADPPDPTVARTLLHSARALLPTGPAAASITERQWQADAAEPARPASPGAVELARAMLTPDPDDPIAAVRAAIGSQRAAALTPTEQLQRLAELWGEDGRRILIVISPDDALLARTATLLSHIVHAAELAPPVRLTVVVDQPTWRALERSLDPHALAVLQQALSDREPESRQTSEPPAQRFTTAPQAASPAILPHHRSLPALRDQARLAVRAARRVPAPPANPSALPPEYAHARSRAEALLFAALQADPRTAGLFALNAPGGFRFGARRVEIDLLCAPLALAVEIDGYFHFVDAAAYRRDRAKDWLMQRHGLLVLRFLADDVPDELDTIVNRIARAVALRRSRNAHSTASNPNGNGTG